MTRPWWQTGVIYQIYPRSFADGNGDGMGDLPGITSRLDYLSGVLGVEAIWISPFYPSPQADFGYDVSDYRDVDPQYGNLADFDRLVAEANRRGIRVIVDYVPNHTSDQHPWFVESRSSRDNDKRDWYVWRDAKADGSLPNNWMSAFGGPAWTFDRQAGQYYLHSFLAEQPDLNWRNPEVEEAMLDVLRFWMDRGVSGFRIDVAHRPMKDPLMRDNPPASAVPVDSYKLDPGWAAFEHIYDKADPDIHGLFRRMRQTVEAYPDSVLIGEIHEFDWPTWASYYGSGDELHMPINFVLLPAGADPLKVRTAIIEIEAILGQSLWPNWVVGNHDEPRAVTRLGLEQSRLAAVFLLTARGTPTLYYGDELGMEDLFIPPEQQQDPWGRRRPGVGRDGCRTPMQWDGGPHAGFSPEGTVKTWLPVHPDHKKISVEAEIGDPDSHLSLYRRLLTLRREEPSLHSGSVQVLDGPPGTVVYRRWTDTSRPFTVVLNLSERPVAIDELSGTVVVGTHHGLDDQPFSGRLGPWQGVVIS
jgi:alpha-glucosidase